MRRKQAKTYRSSHIVFIRDSRNHLEARRIECEDSGRIIGEFCVAAKNDGSLRRQRRPQTVNQLIRPRCDRGRLSIGSEGQESKINRVESAMHDTRSDWYPMSWRRLYACKKEAGKTEILVLLYLHTGSRVGFLRDSVQPVHSQKCRSPDSEWFGGLRPSIRPLRSEMWLQAFCVMIIKHTSE